jgi:MFS family permease
MSNYHGAAQARAIGIWTSATSAAMIVGPVLGGLSVDLATWRLAFFINVLPIAAVLWLLTRLEQRDVRLAGTRIDALGACLCAVGLGAAVYSLIDAPTRGWSDARIWAPAATGAALLVAFVWLQARARTPMMPLGLFRVRNFAWGNAATALIYGALALISFLIGVYLQEGPGLSATVAGLAQLPVVFLMILLSPRVGALAGRVGPRAFMTLGPSSWPSARCSSSPCRATSPTGRRSSRTSSPSGSASR